MSYDASGSPVKVVICDLCGEYSWRGDYRWRRMPHSTPDQPLHLCPACQSEAVWCAEHRQYHQADALHRGACASCGGLFTSVARERLARCPACRRAAGEDAAPSAPEHRERPRPLAQLFLALRPWYR